MSQTLGLEGVIGQSEAMEKVFQVVHRIAGTRATLLIRGESGTGKEVVARAVHALGPFAGKGFVTVDCTNIPANLMESELFGHERGAFTDAKSQKSGLMEMADGGSIFLDEIGLMPLELQSKLLNVLETQRFRRVGGTVELTVSVRFLAATNEDLERAVREGRFREDLYYRLNVVPIDLPPLRDRDDDVILLAESAFEEYTTLHGTMPRLLAEDAVALLRSYPWPGNVRELRNAIERAVLMTDKEVIQAEDLIVDRRGRREDGRIGFRVDSEGQIQVEFPPGGLSLEEVERKLIQAALTYTQENVTKAAQLLHVSRDTLRYRIAKYELEADE